MTKSRPYRRLLLVVLLAWLLLPGGAWSAEIHDSCPGTALERGPRLIGNTDRVRRAAREAGFSDQLVFRVLITEDGTVENPTVIAPKSLQRSPKILRAISELRFCPAVRYSRYAAVTVTLHVQVAPLK